MNKVLMSGAMSAALLVGCAHAGDYGRPGYSGYSGGSQRYSSQPYSGGYQPPYERGYEDRGYQDRGYQEGRYQNSGYQGGNQCWQEPVRVIEKPGFFRSNIGLLAGGVAGGLIGGQIGHGTGRKIATWGGALAGAYAGNAYANRYHPANGHESVTYETRCR